MSNSRKNQRYTCLVPVVGKDGGVFDQAKTVDFSKKGLGFVSKRRIPVKKSIPIEIELTLEGKPVFVIGQVQWVRRILNSKSYRIGVSFKNVMQGSRSRLDQFFRNCKTG